MQGVHELVFVDFWTVHGCWFILFMFFFPRLTLLFACTWGGFFWWVGLIFVPRLMVAILATTAYWHTNTFLVVLAWFWALGLERKEKECAGHLQ
eukprot:TRINITY_DN74967_c0_g1_i1.p1 TRINITY_DN74967_c0_g1~~TRINITY_DN74967_c0_g1_i1.p1  ORF type:complete len:108 (+),score=4.22 TRINITY_DN74967_c0_g1_i1:45-326(+)